MNFLSRREFFKHFKNDLIDQVDAATVSDTFSQFSKSGVAQENEVWVQIGRIAECTPGTIREVSVNNRPFFIHSIAEGFWVEDRDTKRIALKTAQGGTVWMNASMPWPVDKILSHLTGEEVHMESQVKTRTTGEER